jgi:hypothetical protein
MEPEIPDGAYCLFRPRGQARERDGGWEDARIVLKPLNPALHLIVLMPNTKVRSGSSPRS